MKWAAMALLLVGPAAQARIITYVEDNPAQDQVALGYPVPVPVDALEPVAGFRRYDTLQARLLDLALRSPVIDRQRVGTSLEGTPIWGFRISDGDALPADGAGAEGAILHSGGLHAREWQTPEALAAIIERLAEHQDDRGFHQFLIEDLHMLLIPVLNPDGFAQTQREAARTTLGNDPGSSTSPRDGRQRRKNMRGETAALVDHELGTEADAVHGVDLNRNFDPFWNSGPGSSADPASIVYHGTAPASEPEARALLDAAATLPSGQLRLYIDSHSFGRSLISNEIGDARLDAITADLARIMGATTNDAPCANPPCRYAHQPVASGNGIGATDEVFSYEFRAPAYTMEIEPSLNGARDYGGRGAPNDGFMLPDAEVPRMREEITTMSLLGYYRQAGPPAVSSVEIYSATDEALVWSGRWTVAGRNRRQLQIVSTRALVDGQAYRLRIQFSRPMRHRGGDGMVANYPGQNIALVPDVRLLAAQPDAELPLAGTAGGWQRSGSRYADDSWETEFLLPPGFAAAAQLDLQVATVDLSGQALDADPATVAQWNNGHWRDYENGAGVAGDQGGADRSYRLLGPAADPNPGAGGGGGGGSGAAGLLLLALLGLRRRGHG